MAEVITFGDWCEAMGWPITLAREVHQEILDREQAELNVAAARGEALCNVSHGAERLPLLDEAGDEVGRVEARIPLLSYLYWGRRPGVGYEAWEDPTFMREYLRDNPQCAVKTVQPRGRIVAGYTGPPRQTIKRYQ